MIQRQKVSGRMATVAYIDEAFQPKPKDEATHAKVSFDDGDVAFLDLREPGEEPEDADFDDLMAEFMDDTEDAENDIDDEEAADAKADKASVNYRPGTPKEHCGICTMFQKPNRCTAVAGDIEASKLCDLFEPEIDAAP
jgi:hypothetical protein